MKIFGSYRLVKNELVRKVQDGSQNRRNTLKGDYM